MQYRAGAHQHVPGIVKDVFDGTLFLLHAFLIIVFGDMPALAMIMHMKGHNGIKPCRMCHIQGLRIPNGTSTTHYIPLDRSTHPAVHTSPELIKIYNPHALPLRTHDEFLRQASQVDSCPTAAEAERLAKLYGIKGLPILSHVPSLRFPISFPFDFMHLIWENVIKTLIQLWTGEYKDLNQGIGSYELPRPVWDAIGAATAASGSTIPYVFGSRPLNIMTERSACTADTWSFWTLYIGPVLLNRKFSDPKYYNHFIDLVKLLHLCLEFEHHQEAISNIREGFIGWAKTYER
jgi:hypothetical protein